MRMGREGRGDKDRMEGGGGISDNSSFRFLYCVNISGENGLWLTTWVTSLVNLRHTCGVTRSLNAFPTNDQMLEAV